jgi:uncharacterized membrane protein
VGLPVAEIGDYFGSMEPDRMTDLGMWIWAGLLTALALIAAFVIAVAWQRWKEGRKDRV